MADLQVRPQGEAGFGKKVSIPGPLPDAPVPFCKTGRGCEKNPGAAGSTAEQLRLRDPGG